MLPTKVHPTQKCEIGKIIPRLNHDLQTNF